ncbi:MAG: glycosyltransferase family 4 protein [Anaerolineae bacterium]|nr:glycosyltransferase family 4 protein [Anaerolineae bacterium]
MKTRVLLVHNNYQLAGGESQAVREQHALFEKNGHPVYLYSRDNDEVNTYNFVRKVTFFLSSFFSWRSYREVRAIVREFKPDVAHVHNVFPLITPSVYWALKHEGVPIIQTIHNFRFLCPNGLFFRNHAPCELCKTGRTWNAVRYRCYRDSFALSALYAGIITLHRLLRTWHQIDCIIALNPFSRSKIIEGRITDPEKVKVLGNFSPRAKRRVGSFEQREPYVAFVGRLSPEKGAEVLVEAAAKVPELGFKILGDGPLEEVLKQRAAHLPNVEFLGWVEGERKSEILRNARALVFPSLCYENFSLAIIDALSVGTPIIGSRLGGVPYILEDGVDSLLFTPGDADALAEHLQEVLHHPDRLLSMGRHGLEVTLPKYSEAAHYDGLMKIHAELAGKDLH